MLTILFEIVHLYDKCRFNTNTEYTVFLRYIKYPWKKHLTCYIVYSLKSFK